MCNVRQIGVDQNRAAADFAWQNSTRIEGITFVSTGVVSWYDWMDAGYLEVGSNEYIVELSRFPASQGGLP